MSPNGNGWNEWSRHVLAELKRLSDGMEKVETRLARMESDLSALRVKAGIWGAVAGAVPATIGIIWVWVTK